MLHAASAPAPAACIASRLPSPDDLAERLAIVAEHPDSDPVFLRTALLRAHGFASEAAFTDAHRRRICAALDNATGRSPIELRLLLVARAFVASPWYLEAVRHGWGDAELFGWAGPMAETTLETSGLVPALALCCPTGARLGGLAGGGATMAAPQEEPRQCVFYRFGRRVFVPFYEQLTHRTTASTSRAHQEAVAHV